MANYESANGAYPASYGTGAKANGWSGSTWGSWSPQAQLLPFFEQGQLFNAINFSLVSHGSGAKAGDMTQITAITTRIASLVCPSAALPAGSYYGARIPETVTLRRWARPSWVAPSGNSAPNGLFMFRWQ